MSAFEMMIRTTVSFIVVYVLCRILSKKLISQMTFFDYVAGITIGSIVASSMFMKDVKISIAMLGLILFCVYVFVTSIIALKSLTARKVLESEPTYLIQNGQILEEALKKNRFSMDDLVANLRKKNVFYLDQVEAAILENDGTVSVLRKPNYLPAVKQDVFSVTSSRGIAQAFIVDGKILSKSLELLGKDTAWVSAVLKMNNIEKVEDVFFAQIDQQNNVYIDKRNDLI